MNAIIDTNVLISGIFFESGLPDKIIKALISGKFNLVISPAILTEYKDLLSVSGYKGIEVLPPRRFAEKYIR